MPRLPAGTVTFLFADVEGSTRRVERDAFAAGRGLADVLKAIRTVVESNNGILFETVGDAGYAAFQRPSDAAAAAAGIHDALGALASAKAPPMRVRIAIHTGEVESRGRHYFGAPLFRCARLQALAWGGQTLLSGVTARLVMGSVPDHYRLEDRGSHRLKDLDEPELVHELVGPATPSFPPLRSVESRPTNLPDRLPVLVGRAEDARAVDEMLSSASLITITGPGGTGKTALAIAVAAGRLATMPDGAWLVDLAPIRDPELVPAAIASTIGVDEQPPTPLAETLHDYLHAKRILLVLDNFEQVAKAAPTVVRLFDSSETRVIATSREALRVRQEREYALAPLSVAAPRDGTTLEEITAIPSVQLFVDRARDTLPSFELTEANATIVASVCRRLDGLPLAIELAAAMIRLLTPQQLLDRLGTRLDLLTARRRDLPERQRSLRAALSWSHELLTDVEKQAFASLAVFAEGFTLSVAEAVLCRLDADVVGLVGTLLDKSLLTRDAESAVETRFRMLDTIRQFALEQLAASADSDAAWLALAEWARSLVTNDGRSMRWSEALSTVDQFRAERNNLVEAARWLHDANRDEAFVDLVAAASSFWIAASLASEALPWVRLAISVANECDLPPSTATARLLRNAGTVEHELGWSERAVELLRRSVDQWARIGDDTGRADALRRLGATLSDRGELGPARDALASALELGRAAADGETQQACLADLAGLAVFDGDIDGARGLLTELLDLCTADGNEYGIGVAQGNIAYVLALTGALEEAEAYGREALELFAKIDKGDMVGWAWINLAGILAQAGKDGEARESLRRGLEVIQEHGNVRDLASGLDVAAELALGQGSSERAAILARTAAGLRSEAGLRVPPIEQQRADSTIARTRELLGTAFDRVMSEARRTPVADVVRAEIALLNTATVEDRV